MQELATNTGKNALTKTRDMETKSEISHYGVRGYSQQTQISYTKPPPWIKWADFLSELRFILCSNLLEMESPTTRNH